MMHGQVPQHYRYIFFISWLSLWSELCNDCQPHLMNIHSMVLIFISGIHGNVWPQQQLDGTETRSKLRTTGCTSIQKIVFALLGLLTVLVVTTLALVFVFRNGKSNDLSQSDGLSNSDGLSKGLSDRGGWLKWSSWGSCSSSCGTGTQQRVRLCLSVDQNVSTCPGQDRETQSCTVIQCPPAPVCFLSYSTFNDSWRRPSYASGNNCDNDIYETSWYRFKLATGENGVINHCPRVNTCGTKSPIWMNGTHPTEYGVIKSVIMATPHGNDCFNWAETALVTKCIKDGEVFFLYKLAKPSYCNRAYCTAKYDLGKP